MQGCILDKELIEKYSWAKIACRRCWLVKKSAEIRNWKWTEPNKNSVYWKISVFMSKGKNTKRKMREGHECIVIQWVPLQLGYVTQVWEPRIHDTQQEAERQDLSGDRQYFLPFRMGNTNYPKPLTDWRTRRELHQLVINLMKKT